MFSDDEPKFHLLVKSYIIICIIILAGNAALGYVKKLKNELSVSKVFLKSITYKSSLEGNFTLGHGTLEERDYYVTYQVLDDGGVILKRFDADDTVIYETLKNGQAYAEIIKDGFGFIKVKLYVPENTIKVEYDFDIKTED